MTLFNKTVSIDENHCANYWHASKARYILEKDILETFPVQLAIEEIAIRVEIINCIDRRLRRF